MDGTEPASTLHAASNVEVERQDLSATDEARDSCADDGTRNDIASIVTFRTALGSRLDYRVRYLEIAKAPNRTYSQKVFSSVLEEVKATQKLAEPDADGFCFRHEDQRA